MTPEVAGDSKPIWQVFQGSRASETVEGEDGEHEAGWQ
jgi:hypothetical protein